MQAAGTTATAPVMQAMRDTPVNDFFARNEDGLMLHDMKLFRVKEPTASKSDWDLYEEVAAVPGDQAFLPLSASRCPLVAHR